MIYEILNNDDQQNYNIKEIKAVQVAPRTTAVSEPLLQAAPPPYL